MALTRIANIASTIPDDSIANVKMANIVQSKNIIINGDMSVAQRSTSTASITTSTYTVDRFQQVFAGTTPGTWTMSQSTDVPTGQGFATSLKLDCTTANGSLSADSLLYLTQKLEGQNLQYIKKGTSSAESLTVSFWVKSNKTGTYIAELNDLDNTRTIHNSYTISVADTWEKKTLTFAGDTSGALGNDNGDSLRLIWWLAAGSNYNSGTLNTAWESTTNANRAVGNVNLADSTSNELYVTGVQLEAGSVASEFEFLPYAQNLQRCFRYYYKYADGDNSSLGLGVVHYANQMDFVITFPTQMRANPTVDQVTGTDYYQFYHNAGDFFNGIDSIQDQGKNQQTYLVLSNISASANECGIVYGANASAYMAADAEL